jgi:galactokinase
VNVTAYAPGRVELLGNHTDYNRGLVIGAAIDRGVRINASARLGETVTLRSDEFEARIEVRLDTLHPLTGDRWANYALGVLREFARAGFKLRGFDARVSGDLPLGVGLSSSAAFEVATAYAVIKLHQLQVDPLAIAQMCRRAENNFVGVNSGLLDQATSVFGRANHVVYLDCDTEKVRSIPFPPNLALVIADSGTTHALVAGQYNARREECAAAARALAVGSLREVTFEKLERARGSLDWRLYHRALHIVSENDRVERAARAMQSGDAQTIGSLMNESHESSRTNFENSTPELDALVMRARALPAVLGSRLTGGGFGGRTITLVDSEHAETTAQQLTAAQITQTGKSAAAFVCRIADGAAVLNAR